MIRNAFSRTFACVLIVVALLFSIPAVAQQTFPVSGTVVDATGTPVAGAAVTLVESRRTVTTDAGGGFRFEGIGDGHYHLQVESRRAGSALVDAVVNGAAVVLTVTVDRAVHSEEIVVSAGVESRKGSEVVQPVNVVNDEELIVRMQPTLGETLATQPGVSSTYFGPGSSRPIVRGLGSDRIRILEDGLGTGDASSVSPDHAVSTDPSSAAQIEIVRGPATLLYGSNAIGGVVNVVTERIPTRTSTSPVNGTLRLRGGTVADERDAGLNLGGGIGNVAWYSDFTRRYTGNYTIPGPADEFDADEGSTDLENSSLEATSGSLGLSFIGARGLVGASWSGFKTNYGVPGHGHHEEASLRTALEEGAEEEGVRIDLDQQRFDFRGELTDLQGFFRNVRLRAGTNSYEHAELEGAEIGTRFENEAYEIRLEATHRQIGRLTGSFGAQFTSNDFLAVGEEAFVPPSLTQSRAVFAFEEVTGEKFDFQVGGRFEQQDVDPEAVELAKRSFDAFSASVGSVFRPAAGYVIAASVARAVRNPTATELFANGPHAATATFEVGDPSLDAETSVGVDLSFRKTEGRVRGELNLFNNSFDGYIYDAPTGEIEDDLPLFAYTQRDARFRGAELELHTELWHSGENHLELEAGADYVRATLRDGGNVPFIPPVRTSLGLRFERGVFSGLLEARRYSDQDKVAEYETSTEGYTLVNASIAHRFFVRNTAHHIVLRGTNLTDKLARSHVSPLKDRAPLPGRDFTLTYQLTF